MGKRAAQAKAGASEGLKRDKEGSEAATPEEEQLVRRHLALGWWSIALFSAFGILLEAAHGLKLAAYLDLANATRRLSFTLGHAHGTLLGFINVAFALSLRQARMSPVTSARVGLALRAATFLMPAGFILGGVVFYAGDPGLGIALVPPGGLLLVVGLFMLARGFSSPPPER